MEKYDVSLLLVVLLLLVLFLALMFNEQISIIGKTIFTSNLTCEPGWKCSDEKTSIYQRGDCELTYKVACLNVCEEGMCK